jgi:hypothetical protein
MTVRVDNKHSRTRVELENQQCKAPVPEITEADAARRHVQVSLLSTRQSLNILLVWWKLETVSTVCATTEAFAALLIQQHVVLLLTFEHAHDQVEALTAASVH